MIGLLFLSLIGIAFIAMLIRYKRKYSNGFEPYVIKKGRHYSLRISRSLPTPWKFAFCRSTIRFTAIFTDGCDYNTSRVDADDINKLYGLCYSWHPHKNSFRIGWRYSSFLRKIELFMYAYIDGARRFQHIGYVAPYELVSFVILRGGPNKDKIIVETKKESAPHHFIDSIVVGKSQSWFNFRLFPFFGGTYPAPNDMKILIKND